MENTSNTISRVEAVVVSIEENSIELQIAGSYETLQWPRNMLQRDIQVGEKILLEIKEHPVTSIQKVVETAKQNGEDKNPTSQRKLLESLIN